MHKDYPKDFATMLRGVAARLDSGEWTLHNSWHDVSADPRASQSVSFTIEPTKANQPAATETRSARCNHPSKYGRHLACNNDLPCDNPEHSEPDLVADKPWLSTKTCPNCKGSCFEDGNTNQPSCRVCGGKGVVPAEPSAPGRPLPAPDEGRRKRLFLVPGLRH